jgi:hypothetical protein
MKKPAVVRSHRLGSADGIIPLDLASRGSLLENGLPFPNLRIQTVRLSCEDFFTDVYGALHSVLDDLFRALIAARNYARKALGATKSQLAYFFRDVEKKVVAQFLQASLACPVDFQSAVGTQQTCITEVSEIEKAVIDDARLLVMVFSAFSEALVQVGQDNSSWFELREKIRPTLYFIDRKIAKHLKKLRQIRKRLARFAGNDIRLSQLG